MANTPNPQPSPHTPSGTVSQQPPFTIINDPPAPGKSVTLEQALANAEKTVNAAK